jgi:hypothetical protein
MARMINAGGLENAAARAGETVNGCANRADNTPNNLTRPCYPDIRIPVSQE